MKGRVTIEYDCPGCDRKAVHSETVETDLTDKELLTSVAQDVGCTNPECLYYAAARGNIRACRVLTLPSQ